LVGFPEASAVSANEHFGTLNFDFEGRTYDFPAANIAIQDRSASVDLEGWKLKLVS